MLILGDSHTECNNFTYPQVQLETKHQKEKENHKIRSPQEGDQDTLFLIFP